MVVMSRKFQTPCLPYSRRIYMCQRGKNSELRNENNARHKNETKFRCQLAYSTLEAVIRRLIGSSDHQSS